MLAVARWCAAGRRAARRLRRRVGRRTRRSPARSLDPPFEVGRDAADRHRRRQPFSLADDTDKQLTLVFFGYTDCPDICRLVMATLAAALTQLDDERPRPGRRRLRHHRPGPRHRGGAPRLPRPLRPRRVGLTGDLDDDREVAKSRGRSSSTEGEKLPSGGYDVTHGTQVIAIDADGPGPVFWDHDTSAGQFRPTIETCSREAMTT